MTPEGRDLLLDHAIDAILEGSPTSEIISDPEITALLLLARALPPLLAIVPPPPHGLRPGRSAFLTAAATQPPRRRFAWPNFGSLTNWLAPAVAVLLLALLLTFMLRDGGFGRLVVPGSAPQQAQSNTPLLFPAETSTPTPTPTPTSTPTPLPTSTPTPLPTATPTVEPSPTPPS